MEKLTIKQQNFARFIFEGHTQREAWGLAGYSTRYPAKWVDSHACNLAALAKIKARVDELQAEVDSKAVAGVEERKKVLTEIVRGRLNQYMKGNRINATVSDLNTAAVSEVVTQEIQLGRGDDIAVVDVVKLKLRDPVSAIAELNKMGGDYAAEKKQIDLNVDVRFVIGKGYQVVDSTAKELTDGNGH